MLSLCTSAEVTVSGAAPVIDATSSSSGTNFTSEFVKTLPVGRGFQADRDQDARRHPGIRGGSTNFNVQGSTGAENNFVIDGVDTTEVQYGRQGKAAPERVHPGVEVKSGGYQAEYGHALGGVLNAVTKRAATRSTATRSVTTPAGRTRPAAASLAGGQQEHPGEVGQLGTNRAQTDPIRNTLRSDFGADLGGFA